MFVHACESGRNYIHACNKKFFEGIMLVENELPCGESCGPQIVMYYLYVYDAVESGIRQLN